MAYVFKQGDVTLEVDAWESAGPHDQPSKGVLVRLHGGRCSLGVVLPVQEAARFLGELTGNVLEQALADMKRKGQER